MGQVVLCLYSKYVSLALPASFCQSSTDVISIMKDTPFADYFSCNPNKVDRIQILSITCRFTIEFKDLSIVILYSSFGLLLRPKDLT